MKVESCAGLTPPAADRPDDGGGRFEGGAVDGQDLAVRRDQRPGGLGRPRSQYLAPEVIDWIIDVTCKDRSYGARPLRRAIQCYVEDPLSEELIRGNLRDGDIKVFLDGGQLAYRPAGELTGGRKLS